VHRRAREGVRSVWLSDRTRPFVIVLVETADQRDHPLGPFGHLGVACASREEIDRLYAEACREGRPTRAPIDAGDSVGYTTRIADPTAIRSSSPLVRRSGSPCSRRRKDEIGRGEVPTRNSPMMLSSMQASSRRGRFARSQNR
jgi:hypothetical protein